MYGIKTQFISTSRLSEIYILVFFPPSFFITNVLLSVHTLFVTFSDILALLSLILSSCWGRFCPKLVGSITPSSSSSSSYPTVIYS